MYLVSSNFDIHVAACTSGLVFIRGITISEPCHEKTYPMPYANHKDQIRLPANPCSLISASVVCLDIIITNVAANTVKLAASEAEQTYLSPPFLHTSEDKFSHGMAYSIFVPALLPSHSVDPARKCLHSC